MDGDQQRIKKCDTQRVGDYQNNRALGGESGKWYCGIIKILRTNLVPRSYCMTDMLPRLTVEGLGMTLPLTPQFTITIYFLIYFLFIYFFSARTIHPHECLDNFHVLARSIPTDTGGLWDSKAQCHSRTGSRIIGFSSYPKTRRWYRLKQQ